MTYKVHLDGHNLVPYLTGETKESPRTSLFYFSDDGDVIAVRNGDYKFVLAEQEANSSWVWMKPFVKLRMPKIYHLRRDPFERADFNSSAYWDWMVAHIYMMYEMQALVAGRSRTSPSSRRARSRPRSTWTR